MGAYVGGGEAVDPVLRSQGFELHELPCIWASLGPDHAVWAPIRGRQVVHDADGYTERGDW